ncbi:hypothetical protein AVEN_210657-1 [Araneus ventricosus]|uniref:Uncharacterized protein n=1 Tax=Araneus ventricosus TaxID=182803 RepID=A0A4Y2HEV3_ARAVE|nr:hypothetical protein AVEN_210657-1 [Araneus ventricosus]
MDFFLWGYLKQQVYATPPPTLQDLQRRIMDACENVTPAMLHRVQREIQARVQICIVADGEKSEHRKERQAINTRLEMDSSFDPGSMLSLPDRALVVKLFYKNGESTSIALRKFRTEKGLKAQKKPYFIE